MTEYIEREHLKDQLSRYLNAPHVRGGYSIGQGMRVAIKSCIAILDEEPTAEVASVRHGHWIFKRQYHDADECNCSNCGQLMTTVHGVRMAYCPQCGFIMDGGADNEK